MKKKIALTILSLAVIGSLSSCVAPTEHTITFNYNGGTGEVTEVSGKAGATITEKIIPTRTGYVFDSWYSDENLSHKVISLSTYPYADVTLYAKWLKEVTVTFNTSTGVAKESIKGVEGERINLGDDPTTTITHQYFDGWYVDANYETPFSQTTYGVEDITLYALWSPYPTISFVTNYQDKTIDTMYVKPGENIPNIDMSWVPLESTGIKFDGWYTDEEFSSQYYFTKMPNESFTIYAKWVSLQTLKFDLSPSTATINDIVAFPGSDIQAPTRPTYAGHYFDGWYTDLNDPASAFTFDKMPEEDVTVYAKWTANPTVTRYDAYDEDNPVLIDSYQAEIDDTIDYSEPSGRNHVDSVFLGWYYRDASGAYTEATSKGPIGHENVTIYARYKKRVYATFTGATTERYDVTTTSVETCPTIGDSTKWLVGWYTSLDADGNGVGNPINFPFASDKDVTLYPVTVNKVSITFQIDTEDFVLEGGEGLGVTLTSEIEEAIEAYLTANNIENYKWCMVINGITTETEFDPKVFPSTNIIVELVDIGSSFVPDIDL